jgi:hypothetical protein
MISTRERFVALITFGLSIRKLFSDMRTRVSGSEC